jgi:hypothetical protein
MMAPLTAVMWVALVLSVCSFVAFVVFAALGFRKRTAPIVQLGVAPGQQPAALPDITKLIEALGKLAESLAKFTESLAKAGPAIAALVASMVFLLAALVAAR